MKKTLDHWLKELESIHPLSMDFKLARIISVFNKMALGKIAPLIITVAGTNGKGSTSTTTAALFQALGADVGLYTSPHLHRFNERIVINQKVVSDDDLINAFEYIHTIRGEITLTYFEYATLAAFYLFSKAKVDVAVLEVGLGGRLDATNIVDADIAIITPIAIDHVAQLGSNLDGIAYEKAGVIKPHAQVISSEKSPSLSIINQAHKMGAPFYHLGKDFSFQILPEQNQWHFQSSNINLILNAPTLRGEHQYQNAAAAIQTIMLSPYKNQVSEYNINQGLQSVILKGRLQKTAFPNGPTIYFDVAHNAQGAEILYKEFSQLKSTQKIYTVLGMLSDKDAHEVASALYSIVDLWILCPLLNARGQSAEELQKKIKGVINQSQMITALDIADGCEKALNISQKNDIILVFGSFHTVSEGLNWIEERTYNG